jgi:sulfoquinovosidase
MDRREFISSAGATAVVLASSSPPSAAAPATDLLAESYPIGNFILRRSGNRLAVLDSEMPERILWETPADGNFIGAQNAMETIKAFGTPEGSYDITDQVSASYESPTIAAIELASGKATIAGQLTSRSGKIGYTLVFEAVSASHLRFTASAEGANRILLAAASVPEEGIFGFGQQLTYFNQKGYILPILVQEHGVGRGRPVLTQLVDAFTNRGGGSPHNTEAPAPHFITSRLRSLFLENTEYSTFDMRLKDRIEIKVWSGSLTGRILKGRTPLDLVEAYADFCGRMRVLPDWVHRGVIVSVQGGTEAVRAKLKTLNEAGVPLAGLWIQDWPGVRVTSAGKQLWWDWKLDENFYPEWKGIVADIEAQGARILTYINPFLSTEEGHNQLFSEGKEKGYLVRHEDGSPYLIKNTNFAAALVDLSNPDARTWIKSVMKSEMIGNTRASGWMNDFGEAMPFDAKLAPGIDAKAWHNQYCIEWARVAREAIDDAGRGDDIVFFDRSGFTQSPGAATLFWLGDQIQSWDEYDGIKTAVVGLLSGGVSGFSLLHSDNGGYVTFQFALGDHTIPIIARGPELFMRWIELNAFTAFFRTHEGLDPSISAQFDTNADTLAHLKRFAKIYKGIGAYRKGLVAEAAAHGYPVVRHPFLHYPDDPNTYELRYQFLLGEHLMVAPVLDQGMDTVEVYFPSGSSWLDLWSGTDVGSPGKWLRMPAPLGRPAVFIRKDTASGAVIVDGLKAEGVL